MKLEDSAMSHLDFVSTANSSKTFSSWVDSWSVFVTPHDERHVIKLWNSLAKQPHWNRGQITHMNVCFFCVIVSGFSACSINCMVQWFSWYLSSSAQIVLHMAVVARWLSTTPRSGCHYRHMQDSLSTCTRTCTCIHEDVHSQWLLLSQITSIFHRFILAILHQKNISLFYPCYPTSKIS